MKVKKCSWDLWVRQQIQQEEEIVHTQDLFISLRTTASHCFPSNCYCDRLFSSTPPYTHLSFFLLLSSAFSNSVIAAELAKKKKCAAVAAPRLQKAEEYLANLKCSVNTCM